VAVVSKKKVPTLESSEEFLALATAVAKERFGPDRVADAYHPVLAIAVAAQDPELTSLQRANLDDKVAQYLFPKKKAIEVKGDGYAQPTIQIIHYGGAKPVEHLEGSTDGERPALPAAPRPTPDS
jgi:hypothetical protein